MKNFKEFLENNYIWFIPVMIILIVIISVAITNGGIRSTSYEDNLDNAIKKMNTGEKLTQGEARAYRDFEEWVFENN